MVDNVMKLKSLLGKCAGVREKAIVSFLDLPLVRSTLIPPRELRLRVGAAFSDPQYYKRIGEEYVQHCVNLGSLHPSNDILDLGCGVGQVAIHLTGYLSRSSSYVGIDVDRQMIEWCTQHIASKHPNFRFELVDIYNRMYNPAGKLDPSKWQFPFVDQSFEFVLAKSVFTHMLPDQIENYLSQITRLLRTGGRCLVTYFLLNAQSIQLLQQNKSAIDFAYEYDEYRTINQDEKELAVSYDEKFIRKLYGKNGLVVKEPIPSLNPDPYQDIIVAIKK
jgi:SAM-dependent methyltransferase